MFGDRPSLLNDPNHFVNIQKKRQKNPTHIFRQTIWEEGEPLDRDVDDLSNSFRLIISATTIATHSLSHLPANLRVTDWLSFDQWYESPPGCCVRPYHQSNGPSNPLKAAPQLSLIAAKCILGHTSDQWEYDPPRFQVVRRSDCSLDRIVVWAFHDDSAPPLRNFIRAVSRHVNNSQTTMRQPARQRRWVTTDLKPAPRPRRLGQPGTWSQLKDNLEPGLSWNSAAAATRIFPAPAFLLSDSPCRGCGGSSLLGQLTQTRVSKPKWCLFSFFPIAYFLSFRPLMVGKGLHCWCRLVVF